MAEPEGACGGAPAAALSVLTRRLDARWCWADRCRGSAQRISGVLPSRGGRATRVVVAVRDRRGRATLAAASPGLSRLSTSGLPRAHVSRHARRCRDRRSRRGPPSPADSGRVQVGIYIHNVMRSTLRPHMASMTGRGDGVVHCELALDQYATRLPCRSAAPHPPHMHTSCDPSPVCVESGNATHVVSIIALHVV